MKDFKGKVVVITGAGPRMGRGIAYHCAQMEMKIVLADIGTESLIRTTADLQTTGAETLTVQTDISRLEDVKNVGRRLGWSNAGFWSSWLKRRPACLAGYR